MNIMACFPSRFLKAGDLRGRTVEVVMDRVEIEQLQDEALPVLYFRGVEKPLVLNKTNSRAIASLYTEETDAWSGKLLVLFPAMTEFKGAAVDCIRVRAPNAPVVDVKAYTEARRESRKALGRTSDVIWDTDAVREPTHEEFEEGVERWGNAQGDRMLRALRTNGHADPSYVDLMNGGSHG